MQFGSLVIRIKEIEEIEKKYVYAKRIDTRTKTIWESKKA